MPTEQMSLISQKIDDALAQVYFNEEMIEKASGGSHKIPADALIFSLFNSLDNLNEKDVKYGVMKVILEDKELAKNMISEVQMRKWQKAEALCESLIDDMSVIDGTR